MERRITLESYTEQRCQEFWKQYVPDPQMTNQPYTYDPQWVRRYYESKVLDPNRRFFAICATGETIGEISLKKLDLEKGEGTLSVLIANDRHKDCGFGTEAQRQMVAYGLEQLGLRRIFADCVQRNKRSQHVLEKIGFQPLGEDETFKYYVLEAKEAKLWRSTHICERP